jgi:AraC-like DNA-binding protein
MARHPVGVYRERRSRLAGAVVWERVAGTTPFRVVPDGCMDLIWAAGALLVAGPDTSSHWVAGLPGERFTGLRFAPGTGPAVVGVPAQDLRDQRVSVDALWSPGVVRHVVDRIGAAPRTGPALEAIAIDRLRRNGPPDPVVAEIAAGLHAGHSVAAVAQAVDLSERQLHRRCLAAFGYGPKTLARIQRMERALRLVRDGTPLSQVAVLAGYADQAHLAREIKLLTGAPPSDLAAEES